MAKDLKRSDTTPSATMPASTSHPQLGPDTVRAPLEAIRDRESDTRATTVKHVAKLAASICEVGLIHPIVVDQRGTLLAGGHRLAALHRIQSERPDVFEQWFAKGQVPVRVIDVDTNPTNRRALEIEISENEKRRDYTTKDLTQLVERLKEAGYSTRLGGPASGRRHVTGALAIIIGKSERTVRRMLQKQPSADAEETLDKAVRSLKRSLKRSLAAIEEAGNSDEAVDKLRRWAMRGIPLTNACMPEVDDEEAEDKVA